MKLSELKEIAKNAKKNPYQWDFNSTLEYIGTMGPSRLLKMISLLEEAKELIAQTEMTRNAFAHYNITGISLNNSEEEKWLQEFEKEFGE